MSSSCRARRYNASDCQIIVVGVARIRIEERPARDGATLDSLICKER